MIKAQIDAGCRDREVRGKQTESLFEDVLPGNRQHSAVSAIIVLSAGNHHRGVRGQPPTKQQQEEIQGGGERHDCRMTSAGVCLSSTIYTHTQMYKYRNETTTIYFLFD